MRDKIIFDAVMTINEHYRQENTNTYTYTGTHTHTHTFASTQRNIKSSSQTARWLHLIVKKMTESMHTIMFPSQITASLL